MGFRGFSALGLQGFQAFRGAGFSALGVSGFRAFRPSGSGGVYVGFKSRVSGLGFGV